MNGAEEKGGEEGTDAEPSAEWSGVFDARGKAANCAESIPSLTPRKVAAEGETCFLEGVSGSAAFLLDGEYVVYDST